MKFKKIAAVLLTSVMASSFVAGCSRKVFHKTGHKSKHIRLFRIPAVLHEMVHKHRIAARKGAELAEDFETSIDLDMDAFIPPSYIPNEYQKLDIYKRIAGIETQDEAEANTGLRPAAVNVSFPSYCLTSPEIRSVWIFACSYSIIRSVVPFCVISLIYARCAFAFTCAIESRRGRPCGNLRGMRFAVTFKL